jgi:hypothetical protein
MLRASILALAMLAAGPAASAQGNSYVLVELFTAQGCVECAPAHDVIGSLAREPRIVALTYSVPYWDYLGWRDTHAKDVFSQRQRAYATRFRTRSVYTPQIVVNGRDHANGAHAERVREIVSTPAPFRNAHLTLSRQGERIAVHIGRGAVRASAADVWLVRYAPGEQTVEVRSGENAGETVRQVNVVNELTRLGQWNGAPRRFEATCAGACAVIVQETRGGPVLSVASSRAKR